MRSWCSTVLSTGLAIALTVAALPQGAGAQGSPERTKSRPLYLSGEGRGVLTPDLEVLASYGLNLRAVGAGSETTEIAVALPKDSSLEILALDRALGVVSEGQTKLLTRLEFTDGEGGRFQIVDPRLVAEEGSGGSVWSLRQGERDLLLLLSDSPAEMDPGNGRVRWDGLRVLLTEEGASLLGMPEVAGTQIGSLVIEAKMASTGTRGELDTLEGHPVSDGDSVSRLGGIGPDVIVGDLPSVANWGTVGSIRAYSVATTSCNIGDENLDWFSSNPNHPVIGQNLYRFKDGRFEMLGQSWLKHGFFALSEGLCFNDCQSTGGSQLGVHCSDPYSAGLNGSRSGLGPKSQVNASTGAFPYPPTRPSSSNVILGRLQVHVDDVDPSLNSGARYFVEGHYVTPDDSAAGNAVNNASYREVNVSGGNRNLVPTGSTQREFPAIFAWPTLETGVLPAKLDVPGDGRFNVMSKATDLGRGMWHYEYAVHNLNSHRSGQSFSIPLPPGASVSNIGFHDVNAHSGEPYSGADWTSNVQAGNSITWSTQTMAENVNANALRWGTLYNFRFDCNCAPMDGMATLGLFRPGATNDVTTVARVPGTPPGDVPDLSIEGFQVDYDPSDGDIDAGPGAISQELAIVMTVRNRGSIPILSADLTVELNVNGGVVKSENAIVSDFDSAPGTQSLAAGASADVVFVFGAGVLDRCGSYDLVGFHEPSNLETLGMGGSMFGDDVVANDSLNGTGPLLDFGSIIATIIPASVILEDPSTEKLKVDLDYTGLGPGMDTHDVDLTADLTDVNGIVQYLNVFQVSRAGVSSGGSRTVRIRIDVGALFPAPGPGSEFRVRLRLRDTNSTEICLTSLTGNTTTVQ